MAFVCWLALLSPSVGPLPDTKFRDDPSLPDPIGLLTPGSGHENRYLPPDDCSILRKHPPGPPHPTYGIAPTRGCCCCEDTWVSWLNLQEVTCRLWHCLSCDDAEVQGRRIRSVLASDRPEHHKREEVVRAMKPGMAVGQVHRALASRRDYALVLRNATVYFDLDLAVAHDGCVVQEAGPIETWVRGRLEAPLYNSRFDIVNAIGR